jgi:hypothetical protein
MPETNDPAMRLRIALRDLSPEDDPDDFTEVVAAFCAMAPPVTLDGAPKLALANEFDFAQSVIRDWATGAVTPAPKFRRRVARFIRACAPNLGVEG